jgi:flagellar protein FliL
MATSPTVLASASTPSPVSPAPTSTAAKLPVIAMLLAVVAGVVIATVGIGGVVYYLVRTGRFPVQGMAPGKAEPVVPAVTHAIVLEPLLVNLADAGGSSYLRVALTLRVTDPADKKGSQTKDGKSKDDKNASDEAAAAVRDTVLTVLGRQTADGLLATDGKEHLKSALKTALAEHDADLKVMDIYFADFLVQR